MTFACGMVLLLSLALDPAYAQTTDLLVFAGNGTPQDLQTPILERCCPELSHGQQRGEGNPGQQGDDRFVSEGRAPNARFPATSGWGYARFPCDTVRKTFTPCGKDAAFGQECYSCHTISVER
jgi:hypothetical protein